MPDIIARLASQRIRRTVPLHAVPAVGDPLDAPFLAIAWNPRCGADVLSSDCVV